MKKDFGFLFWFHLLLILLCISSPFWLNWRFVLIGMFLSWLQYLLIGGCYLTQLELGKDGVFWHHYLVKIFPRLNRTATKIFARWILPLIIAVSAYLLQKYDFMPFVKRI